MLYVIKGFLYSLSKRRSGMGMLLNIQMSIFGNYHIETTANNISILMQKLNELGKFEFLPNIVEGQNIDILAGKISTTSNVSFITSSQLCRVMCMDNRIDCILTFNPDYQDTIENSLQFCNDVLTVIMESFPILGNRLAININELSNPISTDLLETKLGKSIISVLDFYKNKTLEEWSTRSNTRFPINISEKAEMLNIITELNIVKNDQTMEKRVLCHIDINTIPENQGFRFTNGDLSSFIKETKKIISNIKDNFEELDDCE